MNPLLLDYQLCFALYAASRALTAAYTPYLEPLGLTYPQYLVFLVLWEVETASVKQLGDRLFLDSGTLTPLLKKLEARGWVTRARDAEDNRIVRVSLTDAGRALRAQAVEIPAAVACQTGMDLPTYLRVRRDLESLTQALHARAAAPLAPSPSEDTP